MGEAEFRRRENQRKYSGHIEMLENELGMVEYALDGGATIAHDPKTKKFVSLRGIRNSVSTKLNKLMRRVSPRQFADNFTNPATA